MLGPAYSAILTPSAPVAAGVDGLTYDSQVHWWLLVAVLALVVGVVAGFGLGRFSQRAHTHRTNLPITPAIPSSAQPAPAQSTPTQLAAAELARQAFDAAPTAIVVADGDGSIHLANPAAHQLGVVTGTGLNGRIRQRVLRAAARQGVEKADSWEVLGLRRATELLDVTAQPLGDARVLVIATDETASRAAELLRRDFVANVSHELKSPVTAIGLLAEAILEATDSPETVEVFAQRMQRETARLAALITDIIALSAIQGGGLHEVEEVALAQVIGDAVDRVTVTASAADITVDVQARQAAVVLGDQELLTTAVGNLIDNAVQYSEPGSTVTVTVTTDAGMVNVAVADRGIGISPADQARVFERFFRADPARSRATGGTGLGLAIVKHVAANHRGSIRLQSSIGHGTTFTLRLPLAGTAAAPALIDQPDLAPSALPPLHQVSQL